ncbi:MAG: histidine triad nucleotide-binding protein [Chloroflexi bacterium]|nr:MAG: histidine triad nucleotide-binding protein [Chloroflexota bacterium]
MTPDSDPECIFCKIVGGQIPAAVIYKNDQVTAFRDINPQMPLHVLVVPNKHVANTEVLEPQHDALVGAVVRAARDIARQEGVAERGYRLVINTGRDALNTVPHLHMHMLASCAMSSARRQARSPCLSGRRAATRPRKPTVPSTPART